MRAALRVALVDVNHEPLIDDEMRAGRAWSTEIYKWVLGCPAAIVLVSRAAFESPACQREWAVLHARHHTRRVRVIPVAIDVARDELGLLGDLQAIDGTMGDAAVVSAVVAALQDLPVAEVGADDYLALHRAWIRHLFEAAPVLGHDELTLERIHAPLECVEQTWREVRAGAATAHLPHHATGDALAAALRYLGDPSTRDVLVIQGPAGAGKSTFMLRLARELDRRGLHPVLIRFRDLKLTVPEPLMTKLADAIQLGPEDELPPSPDDELFAESRLQQTIRFANVEIGRTVFLLDGWDEVSLAGSAGYQHQLRSWLPQLRDGLVRRKGPPLRVIVAGRPSLEIAASDFLLDDTRVLTLCPFTPNALEQFVARLRQLAGWTALDFREPLQGYRRRYERSLPIESGRPGVSAAYEMLGYPLLAFLTCRICATEPGLDHALIELPTMLYEKLIEQTVRGGHPESTRAPEHAVHLPAERLRRLMRFTAVSAMLLDDLGVHGQELRARLVELEAGADLESVHGRDLANALVVSYWFKQGHGDFGCEFIHKGFRDFLYAEALVEELRAIAGGACGPQPVPPAPSWRDFVPGTPLHRASRRLARLIGATWLAADVRIHLFTLLERELPRDRAHWLAVRDALVDIYAWWADGGHLRPQLRRAVAAAANGTEWNAGWAPPFVAEMAVWAMPRTSEAHGPVHATATVDAILGDALIQLCAFFHARLPVSTSDASSRRPYRSDDGDDGTRRFRPGGATRGDLQRLISRIDAATGRTAGPGASGLWLQCVDLRGEQLAGARLSEADLTGARLDGADLRGANLVLACLDGACLDGADLRCAAVSGLQLYATTSAGTRIHFREPVASWRGARLPSHLAALIHDAAAQPPRDWFEDVMQTVLSGRASMLDFGEQY